MQRGALVTRRRSAEQNAHVRWCRRRLFISPSSLRWERRHQLVDAGSGRGRVLGRAGSCRPPVQGRETNIFVSPRGRRGARRRAGCRPAARRGRARSGHDCERQLPGRSRQEQRGRRQVPGRSRQDQARRPWRPRRGGSGRRTGEEEQGGERPGSRPASAAEAPRQHRSPTSCSETRSRFQERETRGSRGTNRPIVGGERGGGARGDRW